MMPRPTYLPTELYDSLLETDSKNRAAQAIQGLGWQSKLDDAIAGLQQTYESAFQPMPIVVSDRPDARTIQQQQAQAAPMPTMPLSGPPPTPETPAVPTFSPEDFVHENGVTTYQPSSMPSVTAGAEAAGTGVGPQPGGDLRAHARGVAQQYGLDPDIFERQIDQESGFNPRAVSPAGASGIAQFMPATARGMGLADPFEPYSALDAAARHMRDNLKANGGDYARALAAYNAGQGAVDEYGGVPPYQETQNYVRIILGGKTPAAPNAGAAQPSAPATPSSQGTSAGTVPAPQPPADASPLDQARATYGDGSGDMQRQALSMPADEILGDGQASPDSASTNFAPGDGGTAPTPEPTQYDIQGATSGGPPPPGAQYAGPFPTTRPVLSGQPDPQIDVVGAATNQEVRAPSYEAPVAPRPQPTEQPQIAEQSMPSSGALERLYDTAGNAIGWVRAAVQGAADQIGANMEGNRQAVTDANAATGYGQVSSPGPGEPDYVGKPASPFQIAADAVQPLIRPAGGVPEDMARQEQIAQQAAEWIGSTDPNERITRRAVNDPAWRAAFPPLAQEYDDLETQIALNVMGQAGDVAGVARNSAAQASRIIRQVGPAAARRIPGLGSQGAARGGVQAAEGAATSVASAAPGIGARVRSALDANAERTAAADARMAAEGSTTTAGTVGAVPESRRMYHGTASEFGAPDPTKFDENGLFGPGYYLTSDPRVANSYAEARAVGAQGAQVQNVAVRINEIDAELGTLRGVPGREDRIASLERERSDLTDRWGEDFTPVGQNVRAVDVPSGLNLLDVDAPLQSQPTLLDAMEQAMGYPAMVTTFRNKMRSQASTGKAMTVENAWRALEDTYRSSYTSGAYEFLHNDLKHAGFDGITHRGGQRVPLRDAAGNAIEHDVTIVFPESLPKITNGFSGEVGGATIGPVPSAGSGTLAQINADIGSSLGSSVFGAAAGAATDPEDPQRGAQRGALIGLGAGPLASRAMRSRGGALATPGVAPGPGQPKRVLRGGPIKMTEAEEVGRLRLDKFPEEVRADIEAAAKGLNFAHEQRRGILPDAVVQQMAGDDLKSVDQLIKGGKIGRSYNAEETVAVRNAVASQAQVVRELSEEIAQARSNGMAPELLIARRAAESTKLNGLVQIAEGARAEAGRTLRQYRQQANLIELNPNEAVERIYKKLGGRDNATEAVDEYTKMVEDGANPIQLAKFWAKVEAGKITGADLFSLYRRFNMLSGPRTIEVNALSGAVNLGYEVIGSALGAAARLRGTDAAAEFAAPFKASGRAFQNMAETMWHGVSTEQAARGDIPRTLSSRTDNRLAQGALTLMETPDRFNAGVDQFFRTMTEDWAATKLAQQQAREAKITPRSKEWAETVAANLEAIRDDPSKFPQIKEMADHVTFSEEPGGIGKGLEAFRQKAPLMANLVMPFIRTPYNIASRAIDLSPLGVIRTGVEAATGRGRGTENMPRRLRDNLIGTGAAVWAYDQAQRGNITGAGPDDPEKVAMLRSTGWRPYSVKIGDEYWSYANFAPFSLTLSLAAAASETQKYAKPGKSDPLSMLSDGAARTAKVVTDMTVLAGIGAVVKSIQDPDRYGTQWLTQFLQTLIPAGSALNTVGQAIDTEGERRAERDSFGNQVTGGLLSRIPPNPLTPDRTDVPVAQDPLGDPVPNNQSGFRALNPFRPSPSVDAPVARAFLDAGIDIGAPPKTFTDSGVKIELTAEQQRAYQRYMGEEIRRGFSRANGASPKRRIELLTDLYNESREKAMTRVQGDIGRSEIRNRVRAGPAR